MRPLFLLFLPLLLGGCLGYKEITLKEVRSVELQRFDHEGLFLAIDAVIDNPNGYRIKASDPDVDLYLNGASVGKAHLDSVLTLNKRSTKSYLVPVRVVLSSDQFTSLLLATAFSGKARLGVKGTLVGHAGPFKHRFPFELEQEVMLER